MVSLMQPTGAPGGATGAAASARGGKFAMMVFWACLSFSLAKADTKFTPKLRSACEGASMPAQSCPTRRGR